MKRLTFLTCHHKAPLVEAALAGCGFNVETLDSLDTDRFGTFSREVERRSSAHETAWPRHGWPPTTPAAAMDWAAKAASAATPT